MDLVFSEGDPFLGDLKEIFDILNVSRGEFEEIVAQLAADTEYEIGQRHQRLEELRRQVDLTRTIKQIAFMRAGLNRPASANEPTNELFEMLQRQAEVQALEEELAAYLKLQAEARPHDDALF